MSELPTLSNRNVTLRPWRLDDASALLREIQDPQIVRWLGIELPYSEADAVSFIAGSAEKWNNREAADFVMTDRSETFLGYLGVLAAEAQMAVVEIVYWVAAAKRGHGLAGDALRLVLPWVRSAIEPERIELGMLDGNKASAKTAEAAGFVLREIVQDDQGRTERIYDVHNELRP